MSILLGVIIWVYHAFLFDGTPEEKAWAPVAGMFMGLIIGGVFFVLSLIYYLFVTRNNGK